MCERHRPAPVDHTCSSLGRLCVPTIEAVLHLTRLRTLQLRVQLGTMESQGRCNGNGIATAVRIPRQRRLPLFHGIKIAPVSDQSRSGRTAMYRPRSGPEAPCPSTNPVFHLCHLLQSAGGLCRLVLYCADVDVQPG